MRPCPASADGTAVSASALPPSLCPSLEARRVAWIDGSPSLFGLPVKHSQLSPGGSLGGAGALLSLCGPHGSRPGICLSHKGERSGVTQASRVRMGEGESLAGGATEGLPRSRTVRLSCCSYSSSIAWHLWSPFLPSPPAVHYCPSSWSSHDLRKTVPLTLLSPSSRSTGQPTGFPL